MTSRHCLALVVLGLCLSGTVGQAPPVCPSGYFGLRDADDCKAYTCVYSRFNQFRLTGTCGSGRCFVPSHNICALPSELRCGASMGTTRLEQPRVFAFFAFNG